MIRKKVSLPSHHRHSLASILVFLAVSTVLLSGLYLALNSNVAISKVETGNILIKDGDIAAAKVAVQQSFENYEFGITDEKGVTIYYHPADAGLSVDADKSVAMALQNQASSSLLHRLSWWRSEQTPLVMTADETKLSTFVKDKFVHTITSPTNATLSVADDGTISTTKDTTGQAFTITEPRSQLLKNTGLLQPITYRLTKQTTYAPVRLGDITFIARQASQISQLPVTLTLDGTVFTPDQATKASWVEPVTAEASQARLEISSGRVQNYIDTIASDYVNPPVNAVSIKRTDGSDVVLSYGHNGTDVTNKQTIATDIAAALTSGKAVTKDLTISEAPYQTVSAFNYDKWILVDLTNKRLDAYEKDTIVNSFPVSAGGPATPTAVGEFKIYHKTRIQDMRGANVDGSSYFQPNVEWNSFFYGDMAIHGNYWRPSSWFGNVNSSHGCVGMMNPDARWVYEWAPVGTPVITHY